MRKTNLRQWLASGAAAGAISLAMGTPAAAEQANQATFAFDQPAMPMAAALQNVGRQTGVNILVNSTLVRDVRSRELKGQLSADAALLALLDGTGLTVRRTASNSVMIVRADQDPQGGSAAGGGATVEALIVTAQKREEDIQDVPIAISAFSQEDLTRSQIAGGPDLVTQVPNLTFTKTNFASYSIQIRGIGTQAISATVDPAVAVAFNNTPFLRNRFFEQEFYDLQRVEVLRGPQGTLYGRNATGGVVNIISAKPTPFFEAKLSADVGNYSSTRLEGMVNIPLVEDRIAVRLAGAWTKREGYATNQLTGSQIDGRDLWSARATLGLEPTERISAYLTYEHFEEDDDRLRSGKQLCKKAPTPTEIGGVPVTPDTGGTFGLLSFLSQGCEAASLYSADSFQTPNAFALPYWGGLASLGLPVDTRVDPYLSETQSQDLRVISSTFEPQYRAKTDIVHFQFNWDIADALTLTSETAYGADRVFSTQDYNRFTTRPNAFDLTSLGGQQLIERGILSADGFFCDPQLGCSDRLLLADLSTADSQQYSQELRLTSAYDGPFNFSLGVNFLRHDAEDKYYVFANTLTMHSATWGRVGFTAQGMPLWEAGVTSNIDCIFHPVAGDPTALAQVNQCIYIDPNPIGALNDLGHNYFLSRNPYRLISYAAFGELYYNITPELKLTAGLRYTVDKKHAPEHPSWLLTSPTQSSPFGSVGHPAVGAVDQEWREPTGRVVLDWQPALDFTDETLVYASYAHGYKAGGANPPRPVIATYGTTGTNEGFLETLLTHPKTFDPEFIDAYEIGTKNTFFDGRTTLNLTGFYYDYEGYQISEIVNRAAVNRNFDAKVWGAELELDWRPIDNLRFGLKGGWERTRVADGERVIDLIDRTAGDPEYMVIKAFATVPSNCIVPVEWMADQLPAAPVNACLSYYTDTPMAGLENVPNNGEGIFKDLSGNELPNAPEFTTTLTVDYTLPLPDEWLMTLHADLYRQSEAWARIINNDPYDRIKPYETVNFAAIFTHDDGWNVMAYVKNVFDKDAITGTFLNSDNSGLTTNVFLTDPRLYGVRVTREFVGSRTTFPDLSDALGGELRVELGATADQTDAPNAPIWPSWVEEYEADFPFPHEAQDRDFDWGDGREVKLTWSPSNSRWSISGGVRYGRANLSDRTERLMLVERVQSPFIAIKYYDIYNHAVAAVTEREEHTLVDFAVGADVGMGLFDSRVEFGVRYAEFTSETTLDLHGTPDHYLTDLPNFSTGKRLTIYRSQYAADRTFEGTGPHLSWQAAVPVLGGEESGRLSVEWGVAGGMVFGERTMRLPGETCTLRFEGSPIQLSLGAIHGLCQGTTSEVTRTDDVTVPNLGANLGLAYEVGRVKLSTGYRWERFYDAIDGGFEEEQSYDRTIDGPYLKLSVGFGGG